MAWHAERLPIAAVGRVVVTVAIYVIDVRFALARDYSPARLTREPVAPQRKVANRKPSLDTGVHLSTRLPTLFRKFVPGCQW